MAVALSLALGASREARAQASSAEQRAAAQALFDDARKLIADQRWKEACPKLEESQRLDPGIGTLLNLAECQSQVGKTASAWANFLEAAYQAKAAGQAKREATARSRANALEPRLSRLTVLAVTGSGTVEIKRDGNVVSSSLVGTAVPVDPGEHTVSASAPGKRSWSTTVVVRGDGQQVTVSVPQLEDGPAGAPVGPPPPLAPKVADAKGPLVPPEEPPPSGPPPNLDTGRGPRAAGFVLTFVGVGGLAAAAAFTVLAKNKLNDSNAEGCNATTNVCSNQSAFDTRSSARTFGSAATGTWIGGGVLTGAGIGLLIAGAVIKGRETASGPVITPAVVVGGRDGTTFGAVGRF